MSSEKCAKFSGLIASISIALRIVFESKSDVFVNLSTRFGKSVVFQAFRALPIMYSCVDPTREKNIVLVVSQVINLMKD